MRRVLLGEMTPEEAMAGLEKRLTMLDQNSARLRSEEQARRDRFERSEAELAELSDSADDDEFDSERIMDGLKVLGYLAFSGVLIPASLMQLLALGVDHPLLSTSALLLFLWSFTAVLRFIVRLGLSSKAGRAGEHPKRTRVRGFISSNRLWIVGLLLLIMVAALRIFLSL